MANLEVSMVQAKDGASLQPKFAAEALGDGTFSLPAAAENVNPIAEAPHPAPERTPDPMPLRPPAPPVAYPTRHGTERYEKCAVTASENLIYATTLEAYDRDGNTDIVDIIFAAGTENFDEYEAFRVKHMRVEFLGTANEIKATGLMNFAYVLDPYRDETPGNDGYIDFRYQDRFKYKFGEALYWDVPVTDKWFYTVQEGDKRNTSPGRIVLSSAPLFRVAGTALAQRSVPVTIKMQLEYKVTKYNFNAEKLYKYYEGGIEIGPAVDRNSGFLSQRTDKTIILSWYTDELDFLNVILPITKGNFVLQTVVPVTVTILVHAGTDNTEDETFEYLISEGSFTFVPSEIEGNPGAIRFACDVNFLQSWNIDFTDGVTPIDVAFSPSSIATTPFIIHYSQSTFTL